MRLLRHRISHAAALLALLLAAAPLAGCHDKPPSAAAPVASASVVTPWDGMRRDEQRARTVRQLVEQQAAKQQKQIAHDTQ